MKYKTNTKHFIKQTPIKLIPKLTFFLSFFFALSSRRQQQEKQKKLFISSSKCLQWRSRFQPEILTQTSLHSTPCTPLSPPARATARISTMLKQTFILCLFITNCSWILERISPLMNFFFYPDYRTYSVIIQI